MPLSGDRELSLRSREILQCLLVSPRKGNKAKGSNSQQRFVDRHFSNEGLGYPGKGGSEDKVKCGGWLGVSQTSTTVL